MALVPLLVSLHAVRERGFGPAFRRGFGAAVVFFLLLLYWIPKLPPENVTVPFLLYPALVLAATYLALYVGLFAGLTALAARGRPAALVLAAPGLWVLLEAARGSGPIGFPWGSLGYSQWRGSDLLQLAEWGGLWGVSGLLALVNALVAAALVDNGARRFAWLGVAAALVAGGTLAGRGLGEAAAARAATGPGVDVLLIQPNTGNDKWEPGRRTQVIQGLVDRTLAMAPAVSESALVIWPETATPTLLKHDPPHRALVDPVASITRRALLTGFPDRELDWPEGQGGRSRARYYNAAGLWLPDRGLVEQSAKKQLVPFAEWMPLPGLNRVNFGQGNFTPAESLVVYRQWREPFGVMICFESIFPGLGRDLVRGGARFLVNVTNDQWFGRSAAPWQHLSMAVFRAVENRVGVARAANTGVTCVIEPTGEVRHATPLFEPAVVAARVALHDGPPTLYTRRGDWVLGAAALLALLGAAAGRSGGARR